ncbi:MAG: LysM peptidoglycan-binding domain-containing protein, partial [Anaerolineales bacterium]
MLDVPPATPTPRKEEKTPLRAAQMPTITLSLPAALGLFILMLLLGAGGVFFGLRSTGRVVAPTPQPTATHTPTITPTPTEAPTATPTPTITPLPPFEYTVGSGDTCISIAATFNISYQ